jgi:hypothetical protein
VDVLEFWRDYGSGPSWTHGAVVSPGDVDVDPLLADRLIKWNAEYTEDKIPLDGPGDARRLTEGRNLLAELRNETAGRITIITTERWRADQR